MSRFTCFLAAAALAAAGTVGFANVAGAGEQVGSAPLTIVKTVSGPVPAGTTFTATIECDDTIIFVEGESSTDTATVEFDATGQPTSPDTIEFVDAGSCTVTETATGGAATTTYACEGTAPVDSEGVGGAAVIVDPPPICPTAGPQAEPITVNIESKNQTATVTIHNTFNEPTPQVAPQVVAQPTFTG